MAHTLLFSGYGAPGCDDLAVCRLTADGMLDCVYELDGHMRVLNHDGCTVSTVQASTVPSRAAGRVVPAPRRMAPVCQQPRAQHHLGVAAQRPDPPFPLRMAHRRLAAGAVRGAGHPVSVGCLPTRGRGALLLLFTLAPPRPYRNRPALCCLVLPAHWCWTDFCHCIFSFPHFLLVQAFLLCTITSYLHLSLWQSPYRKSGISLSLLFGMGFL